MNGISPAERVFCAIDTTDLAQATALARALAGAVGGVKLGNEFFTAHGPDGFRAVAATGQRIFLDLKFHDIPNTVAGAVRAARELGCHMLTVHASGGAAMVRAAAGARGGEDGPLILGVTVLTSLGEDDLTAVGQQGPMADQVLRLARLATGAGATGLVASPLEVPALRAGLGAKALLVVPGIRPEWASSDDQKRITTPADAVRAGADYLVVGRPITRADDPAAAARRIAAEIADA
ncbi:MAG: orotidine-5'-phosphate decarboxylase [Alphaproteobacteria bacterium]|nr:orotidine-5'-phosphate decarboxylase [Alphaproteobacteria bacterium]